MAVTMTPLEQNTVDKAFKAARDVLDKLKPVVEQLNVIYDGAGGCKSTITQAKLDSVAGYSGLTKAELDDGLYVLTATLKDALVNGVSQLSKIAARAT